MPYIRGASLREALDVGYAADNKTGSAATLRELAAVATTQAIPRPTTKSTRRELGRQPLCLSAAYYRSTAAIVADAAEAVAEAHHAGIIHRDIKPSNIMLDASGHCWLIDFGLASAAAHEQALEMEPESALMPTDDGQTKTGLLGTFPYLAPEQLQGLADERSDVYGLGATLYELLTWRPPFFFLGFASRERIETLPVDPPRALAPNIESDLQTICLKALHKDPA
jgi:serine/threonine protein kinase